jgi:ubiquinone/menaquinone biosynthesis C-methylase UbiE
VRSDSPTTIATETPTETPTATTTDTPIDTSIDTSGVSRLANAVVLTAAVRGALSSGLLEALWRWQPCAADELAVRSHLSPRAADLTLEALRAGGVVHRDGELWTIAAGPDAWASMLGFEQHVADFIETGEPTCADHPERYRDVLPVIGSFHDAVATGIAPTLIRPDATVLELAAGTAPWSRALLAAEGSATAVAVDLPPVIERLERSLPEDGVGARIACRSGDVRRLKIDERFDVIVVAGICRLLSGDDNARLFADCHRWLAADGQLVVCDALSGTPDPEGSLALYALGLAARSRAQRLWSLADYDAWTHAAGLTRTRLERTERPEVSALVYQHAPTHRSTGPEDLQS